MKKKVLLVTRVSGFVPQHEMNNVKILQEMGYEVHYATNINTVVYGEDNKRLEHTGIRVHPVDFVRTPFSRKTILAYRQLKKLLLEENFDMIHCHMPLSGVLARKAAQDVRKITQKKVPVLYTAHGFHFCKGEPLRNWLYYPIERHLARYTDRLIVMNQEDYRRAGKFPIRGSVEYVPGVGVSLPVFDKTEKEIQPSTAEGKTIVTVGELSARKNHRLLLEMMSELRDLNLVCKIYGSGAEKESLEKEIGERNLQGRVILAGYTHHTAQVLKEADCFVLPSKREGLPVAVMEAMAAGLPVIAARIRGVTDLIEHTKGGYLAKKDDAVDFAVKVRRLFTEKEGKSAVPRATRRQQMGEWNKKRVVAFSKDVVEKRMREIYQAVEKESEVRESENAQ